MLRNSNPYSRILLALALLTGQQTISQAQNAKVAAVVGQAGKASVPRLFLNIQGTIQNAVTNGAFAASGLIDATSLWSVGGGCHTINFSKDTDGTLHALVEGWVFFSGGSLKNAPAVATLSVTLPPPQSNLLVFHDQTTGQLVYWTMNGTKQVTSQTLVPSFPISANWKVVAMADINNDGQTDLLWQDDFTGQLVYWKMKGTNLVKYIFLTPDTVVPATGWKIVGLADADGDGQADILWQNKDTGQIGYWIMKTDSQDNFIEQSVFLLPTPVDKNGIWDVVGVADFNGDGKPDIMLQNRVTKQVGYWLLNGTAIIGIGLITPPNGAVVDATVMGLSDLDGDGNPDLILKDKQGNFSCWLFDGTKATKYIPLTPTNPGSANWKFVGEIATPKPSIGIKITDWFKPATVFASSGLDANSAALPLQFLKGSLKIVP